MIKEHALKSLKPADPSTRKGCNWVLLPGDVVTHWSDSKSCGTIVAMDDKIASVLWNHPPFWGEYTGASLAVEIAEEIDREIIKDLRAKNRTKKKQ